MNPPRFVILPRDKNLIVSILAKISEEKSKNEVRIMSFSYLLKVLNKEEGLLIKKFRDIDPLIYGFKGRYFGIHKVPANLVLIRDQKCRFKGKVRKIENRYLPKPVYSAYKKLNAKLYEDTGKKLLVGSGYRSPAYQVIIFLRYLNFHKFNFNKTIKRVAIPGYSEHGFPRGQAIDFMTDDGIPTVKKPADFAKTVEYKWLLENANKFGFYQSYPRNNKLGVVFEPWHWHFLKLPLLPV